MALQDLTPQLRTRMSRVERVVGLFVFVAALLMAAGFVYYLLEAGKRRGWFINKVPYYCYAREATGLKVGDPVRQRGREVGRIVQIESTPSDPWFLSSNFNVFIKFHIWEPYFGYILTDSRVRLLSADFFGSRFLEVTTGDPDLGFATVLTKPNFSESLILNDRDKNYPNPTNLVRLSETRNGVWLFTEEMPSMGQQAQEIVRVVSESLPQMTVQVSELLVEATGAASNAAVALAQLQPTLDQLATLTERMSEEDGVIGRLLLTTNLQEQVETALASMDATLTNTTELIRTSEVQLQDLTRRLALTLDNVALVTSNLSGQVSANGLMLNEVSSLVVSADDMVRGLKQHWLLRSAFATRTNDPTESVVQPGLGRGSR